MLQFLPGCPDDNKLSLALVMAPFRRQAITWNQWCSGSPMCHHSLKWENTHTHTLTLSLSLSLYIYIYTYIYVYVCVFKSRLRNEGHFVHFSVFQLLFTGIILWMRPANERRRLPLAVRTHKMMIPVSVYIFPQWHNNAPAVTVGYRATNITKGDVLSSARKR